MGTNGEGGCVVATPGRSERSSPTGAQVRLGEEESGTSTGMAKKCNKGLGAAIYISKGAGMPESL